MWSKDRIFVRDAKTSVRTLDKMNNTRPIIKIFLFPYTERTERIFVPILPTFLFLPAHENARYAKMVFRLRIGKLRSFQYENRHNLWASFAIKLYAIFQSVLIHNSFYHMPLLLFSG